MCRRLTKGDLTEDSLFGSDEDCGLALKWDQRDNTLWMRGERVGEHISTGEDLGWIIRLSIRYQDSASEVRKPHEALQAALSELPDEREREVNVEYSTPNKDGLVEAKLTLRYQGTAPDVFIPSFALASALAALPEFSESYPPADLTVKLPEDSIAEEYEVPRFFTERLVKAAGYVWVFHKSDVDPWPSLLHGHEYEHGLKLDALTGNVFDVGTREKCMLLKQKDLDIVQSNLRSSKDFKEKLAKLLRDRSAEWA